MDGFKNYWIKYVIIAINVLHGTLKVNGERHIIESKIKKEAHSKNKITSIYPSLSETLNKFY